MPRPERNAFAVAVPELGPLPVASSAPTKADEEVIAEVTQHAATRDPGLDLVALRIAPSPALVAATVRDSRTLLPGELVVAAGNPLGLVGAVSAGLVQRCNARWVVADVRLAPGNSGGPLADAEGRVIGINSMVAGGLALAVPTAAVAAFLGEDVRAA